MSIVSHLFCFVCSERNTLREENEKLSEKYSKKVDNLNFRNSEYKGTIERLSNELREIEKNNGTHLQEVTNEKDKQIADLQKEISQLEKQRQSNNKNIQNYTVAIVFFLICKHSAIKRNNNPRFTN